MRLISYTLEDKLTIYYHISPKIVGYSHWFEVPENTAYNKTMLMHNIAGMLEIVCMYIYFFA